jgi:hypothetical protein
MSFAPVDGSLRGQYLYIGTDSKFLGLNAALATNGTGAPSLHWMYWNGATGAWTSLETAGFVDGTNDFRQTGSLYWTTANVTSWAPYSVDGSPDLFYVRARLDSGTSYTTPPMEGAIRPDILLLLYCGEITGAGQTLTLGAPLPTAVKLASFEARGLSGAVELEWRTASEIDNLGFHLYRSTSAAGPFHRVSASLVPGLGSSPEGARYRYRDSGLALGATYFYELEDIETSGRTTRHGPLRATTLGEDPRVEAPLEPSLLTFGALDANRYAVPKFDRRGATVELRTQGFLAEPLADGTVRLTVPGFEIGSGSDGAALPFTRPWIDVPAGTVARIVSVEEHSVVTFSSLRPSAREEPFVSASASGVLRLAPGAPRRGGDSGAGPPNLGRRARLGESGFQGDLERAQIELSPFRWNGERQELSLARRLVVNLAFDRRSVERRPARARRSGSAVLARLVTAERGLYAVSYEDLFGKSRRVYPSSNLSLHRLGESVAYHVEPGPDRFAPGSSLFFFSPGASANPYGNEAVFEISLGTPGRLMAAAETPSARGAVQSYRARVEREENRLYQAALVDAEDLWLWDVLFAPAAKRYDFPIEDLAPGSEGARVAVRLQGASDFEADPDHHVRLSINGAFVAEAKWNGKAPRAIVADLAPGSLKEGGNELQLTNVGDTSAPYSMVMLDSFAVEYSRLFEGAHFEGLVRETGVAALTGANGVVRAVDVSDPDRPLWVGTEGGGVGVRENRRYFGTDRPRKPGIRKPLAGRGPSVPDRVDYLVLAPREFLDELSPLLRLRARQGLAAHAVAVEDVFDELGFGESRPQAIRDFLAETYRPSLKYVLLAGDATYDFKDYLGTGVVNRVPPWIVRTPYLWTASDPALASVHGEDSLPDVAIGRLPAASEAELSAMVQKILTHESFPRSSSGRMFVVTDDADAAGSFDSGADALVTGVLRGWNVERIRLAELGVDGARAAIREGFDGGARLMSYVGHGGIHLWADENLLDLDGVDALLPQDRQPLLLTMNCLNGYFHFPYFDSLAESLLEADGRGAIAAFSPSGLSLDSQARRMHELLLDAVLNRSHARLGDAILDVQREFAAEGGPVEILTIYHLLGDPALSLR